MEINVVRTGERYEYEINLADVADVMKKYLEYTPSHGDLYELIGEVMDDVEKRKYHFDDREFRGNCDGFKDFILAQLNLTNKETTDKTIKSLFKRIKIHISVFKKEQDSKSFSVKIKEDLGFEQK
ncbi:TPA_asm: hypothetical protein [Altiarchaeum virus]|nr:TPA_asm: hypothetical protein [Altiarchaeum virus]